MSDTSELIAEAGEIDLQFPHRPILRPSHEQIVCAYQAVLTISHIRAR